MTPSGVTTSGETASGAGRGKRGAMRGRRKSGREVHGLLALDKAPGLSSNAALQQVKRIFQANKAGHGGSLDPLATGVLPLCFGEATKVSQFLLDSDKRYRTRLKLGVRTDTGDSEGSEIEVCEDFGVTRGQVEESLAAFRGDIEQVPPMHSAVKVKGTPLYKLARSGKVVDREPRKVTVYEIALTDFAPPEIEIELACSKGTYIRTIADELGQMLGCGAHVVALRRLRAGGFGEEDCVSADFLERESASGGLAGLDRHLAPVDRPLRDLPAVLLPEIAAKQLRSGQAVLVRHLPAEGLVRMYRETEAAERFIGIGVIDDDGRVAPKRLIGANRN